MDIIERAIRIAVTAHKEQERKTDGSPYVVHPLMVARIVENAGFSNEVIAAAIVHDVLEDTAVDEVELRTQLGDTVVDIVTIVSEDKSLEWKDRKKLYIENIVMASEGAKAVSVADKIHNARSLIEYHAVQGVATWKKFNTSKDEKVWFERELHNRLKEVWGHPLLNEYEDLVNRLETLE